MQELRRIVNAVEARKHRLDIGPVSVQLSERQFKYFDDLFKYSHGKRPGELKEVLRKELSNMERVLYALDLEFGVKSEEIKLDTDS